MAKSPAATSSPSMTPNMKKLLLTLAALAALALPGWAQSTNAPSTAVVVNVITQPPPPPSTVHQIIVPAGAVGSLVSVVAAVDSKLALVPTTQTLQSFNGQRRPDGSY